jgi:hypothetical protein
MANNQRPTKEERAHNRMMEVVADRERKGFGCGQSKAAIKRRAHANRGKLHTGHKPNTVIEMTGHRRYLVVEDGSYRRIPPTVEDMLRAA